MNKIDEMSWHIIDYNDNTKPILTIYPKDLSCYVQIFPSGLRYHRRFWMECLVGKAITLGLII